MLTGVVSHCKQTIIHPHIAPCAAYQCSTRGGELKLEVRGERINISGETVTVLQGTITL